jgi:hypothetical protein
LESGNQRILQLRRGVGSEEFSGSQLNELGRQRGRAALPFNKGVESQDGLLRHAAKRAEQPEGDFEYRMGLKGVRRHVANVI